MYRMYSLSLAAFTLGITISTTLPAVAAPTQPARKSLAMHHKSMARTPAVASRIAVLRFAGPTTIDIDADEIWKVRNKTSAPGQGELKRRVDPLGGLVQAVHGVHAPVVLAEDGLDPPPDARGLTGPTRFRERVGDHEEQVHVRPLLHATGIPRSREG